MCELSSSKHSRKLEKVRKIDPTALVQIEQRLRRSECRREQQKIREIDTTVRVEITNQRDINSGEQRRDRLARAFDLGLTPGALELKNPLGVHDPEPSTAPFASTPSASDALINSGKLTCVTSW